MNKKITIKTPKETKVFTKQKTPKDKFKKIEQKIDKIIKITRK